MMKHKEIKIENAYIRNNVGTKLLRVGRPELLKYIVRVFALDVKITLFNETINKADAAMFANKLSNPFYENEKKTYLSKDSRSICFEVPTPIKKSDQCLRIQ